MELYIKKEENKLGTSQKLNELFDTILTESERVNTVSLSPTRFQL